jgi:urate oxidase
MAVVLGHNQYGKAETRVVRVFRDTEPHEIVDYNVSVALSGDFSDVHLLGDNTKCLTTDATKNTVNAFAKEAGEAVREPESFALALARHFVDDVPQVERARIQVENYPWDRLTGADGKPHPHAFARRGSYVRTATATYSDSRIAAVELIVIDVLTCSRRIPSNSSSMSSSEQIDTPTRPTSPATRECSGSSPICVGRSKATESPLVP